MTQRFTVRQSELAWRELEGQLVLFSDRSGLTHLLDPLASEMLQELMHENAPLTADDLAARLAKELGADERWRPAVADALDELRRMGLAQVIDA